MIQINEKKYELKKFKSLEFAKANKCPQARWDIYNDGFIYAEVEVEGIINQEIIQHIVNDESFRKRVGTILNSTEFFKISDNGTINFDGDPENYLFNLESLIEIYVEYIEKAKGQDREQVSHYGCGS